MPGTETPGAHAAAVAFPATEAVTTGAAPPPEDRAAPRYCTISPSVRSWESSSGFISGRSGYRSIIVPRISTRLIESIPRSASISMSGSSISTG